MLMSHSNKYSTNGSNTHVDSKIASNYNHEDKIGLYIEAQTLKFCNEKKYHSPTINLIFILEKYKARQKHVNPQ